VPAHPLPVRDLLDDDEHRDPRDAVWTRSPSLDAISLAD
jgi:hypothetical protein